jgi:hypothetical protein
MGIAYNTSIVRDGLVLHLDAANIKSYPGSGNTWSDLSGNGNHGTLVNEVGYSSNNGGTITFEGSTNNYITIPYSSSLTPTTSITIDAFYYPQDNGTSWTSLIQYPISSVSHISPYFEWAIYLQMDTKIFHTRINGIAYETLTNAYNLNQWQHFVLTWQPNTVNFYVNAELIGSVTTSPSSIVYDANNPVLIGANSSGGEPAEGNLGSMKVYNKVLTDSEIKQNFEALRGRYGI